MKKTMVFTLLVLLLLTACSGTAASDQDEDTEFFVTVYRSPT